MANGEFEIVHVPSAEQHAYSLTKPLCMEAILSFACQWGVSSRGATIVRFELFFDLR